MYIYIYCTQINGNIYLFVYIVWNEPNINNGFWSGGYDGYLKLYNDLE